MAQQDDGYTAHEIREYRVVFRSGESAILDIECPVAWSDGFSRMLVRRRVNERNVRSLSRVERDVTYE